MIGGDGINDESNKTAPAPTRNTDLTKNTDESFKRFLLELMELRYDTVSTAFATQLATKEWHRQLGGDTIADAILDRIVHNAIWINTGEYNMRQRYGQAMLDD